MFSPPRAGDKKGVRIAWAFNIPLHEEELKLTVRLDAKAGKSDRVFFFFNASINGKRQAIKPGVITYTGTGKWDTLSEDFVITPGMKNIIFQLGLLPGAREPALIDTKKKLGDNFNL